MRLRHLTLPLSLALAGPALASEVQTQSRAAKDFERVQLDGAARLHIHRGDFAVTVSAPADELADEETRVANGTLFIDTRGEDHHGPIDVTIAMPSLSGVVLGGAGDVDVSGFDADAKVELELNGAGNLRYTGSAEALKVKLKGAGNVELSGGKTRRLEVALGGIGKVKARDYPAHDASVSLSGTGEVDFTADGGAVSLALDGLGNIHWRGTASAVSQTENGLGHITHG